MGESQKGGLVLVLQKCIPSTIASIYYHTFKALIYKLHKTVKYSNIL